MEGKKNRYNRIIHYLTFIGVILLVIPASINSFYIPIVLILMGINLFNNSFTNIKGGKLVILGILSFLPTVIYFIITLNL